MDTQTNTQKATVVSIVTNGRYNINQPIIIRLENGKQFRGLGAAGHKYTVGQQVEVEQRDGMTTWHVADAPKHLG